MPDRTSRGAAARTTPQGVARMLKKLFVTAVTGAALVAGSFVASAPAQAGQVTAKAPYPASVVTNCHVKMKKKKVHQGKHPKVKIKITSGAATPVTGKVKVKVANQKKIKNYHGHKKTVKLTKHLSLGKHVVKVKFKPGKNSIFKKCVGAKVVKIVR
jgi:hypothetical protein